MAAKADTRDIVGSKELVDEPAAARKRLDSSFISSNLSNRPRGPVTDPYYGLRSPSAGETLVEFLKYLELSTGKGEGHVKAAMNLAGEIPVESILKSQRMDWSERAIANSHVWTESDSSSDTCHLAETFQCQDQKVAHHKRPRVKCAACGIVTHPGCIPSLEKGHVVCKSTFRLAGKKLRDLRLQAHQWTKFRRCSGSCKKCDRGFGLLGFGSRDFIAQVCVWCMHAYHVNCFDEEVRTSQCSLGELHQSIVPPSWIVKLPPILESSSEGGSMRRRRTTIRKGKKKLYDEKASPHFVVKATTSQRVSPLLVFINPKSGGNQGVKLLSTFQHLLNPRQVFDLTQGGPEFGLRMFAHVNKLRILVCGGDGTVGWVLSKLDDLKSELDVASPPIAVLPLGTGNDLARTLGWGGGYRDEPLVKIIHHVEEGPVVLMDRWALDIRRNDEILGCDDAPGSEDAPLHVVNNYFSIGADAAIALEFHESREANPGKFNSRMKNKLQYVNSSRKELLYRKYVDLCSYIQLFIDGMDYTDRLRAMRFEALVLQNIFKYAAGSTPWGNPSGREFHPQEIDDNLLEVMGMWSKTIAALHLGGHGERLAQGKELKIITSRSLPIQIDGEACMLKPSVICIQRRNQVPMVRKEARRNTRAMGSTFHGPFCTPDEVVKLSIEKLTMEEYEKYKNDLARATKCAKHVCLINTKPSGTLKHLREAITARFSSSSEPVLPKTWCFVDVSYQGSSGMLYQIEQEQETSSFVADMSCDGILILELPEEGSDSDEGTLPAQCRPVPVEATDSLRRESASPEILEQQIHQENDRERNGDLSNGKVNHPQAKYVIQPLLPSTPFEDINEPQYPKLVSSLPPTEEEPEDDESEVSDEILAVASDTSSGDWYFPSDEESPSPPAVQSISHQLCDAAKRGNVEEVKQLIEAGGNFLQTDIEGFTCLHHAARHGRKEVVRHLVQKLPKDALDMQDSIRQQTALHKAAWYGYRTISVLLIEAGASLLIKDYQCYTPYQRSVQSGDEELMKYLQDKEKMERLRVGSQNTDC